MAALAAITPCTGGSPVAGSPFGGFEIDGNLCAEGTGTIDWDSAETGDQPRASDGVGDDTQFTQGASEKNWPWSVSQTQGSGSSPDSTDITNVYAFSRTVRDVFVFVGIERVATTGSVAYYVELNQQENAFGPTPTRTLGDVRLTIEQSGSQLLELVDASTWDGAAWSSLGSLAGFVGRVNQNPVTNFAGDVLGPGSFVEVGVNMTALFGDRCSGAFHNLNIRSASSASETASLADWAQPPVALDVPDTCPSVQVDKTWVIDGTTFGDGSQPAGFSAALSLTGQTSPKFGVVYTERSDGTRYRVGGVVVVDETLSPLPPGCTNVASGDIGGHILTSGPNEFTVTNTVTCTYLTLEKSVVGGTATPDQWTLAASGPTPVTGTGDSRAVTRVHVAPGSYSLTETGPAGYVQTSLTCTPKPVAAGMVTLASGDDVTCTFTNTAAHPVVLTKAWIDAAAGDSVDLQIMNGAATATGSSTAPATTTVATLQALVGDTVDLQETFTTGDPASYASSLACDNDVSVADGSFTVPSALPAGTTITCTFTNARRSAQLTLEKVWVNGSAPDSAALSIDGVNDGSGTSVAPDAPSAANSATATVFAGETVTLSETLTSDPTRPYATTLECDQEGLDWRSGALTGTFTVPTDLDSDVTCTFTNINPTARLTLVKQVAGPAGLTLADPTSWTLSAAGPTPISGVTGEPAVTDVLVGVGDYTLSESRGPAGYVAGAWECSNGDAGGTVSLAPDDDVTCTIVNTLASHTLTLEKVWVNGSAPDSAALSIDGVNDGSGTSVAPDAPSAANSATATVFAGETVALSETLTSDPTRSYATTLECDQEGLDWRSGALTGTFTVPTDLDSDVTCTFTNTRDTASLTVTKVFAQPAGLVLPDGFQFTIPVDCSLDAFDQDVVFTGADVKPGQASVTIEGVPTGTTCEFDEDPPAVVPGWTWGPPTFDPTGQSVTVTTSGPNSATVTNTISRNQHDVTLQKEWVDAASGDTAALAIFGRLTDPAVATSTASGAPGSEVDTADAASTGAFSGETVVVAEMLGESNVGTYRSTWECSAGRAAVASGTGSSGSFTMPDEAVTCTITNTRASAELTLRKEWVNGAAEDTALLTLDGVNDDQATSTATGVAGPQLDTDNQATVNVFSGETVTLREELGAENSGVYLSAIACDSPGLTPDADGQGGAFLVPAGPVSVTCTIRNTWATGSLQVMKKVTGPGAGFVPPATLFKVQVRCEYPDGFPGDDPAPFQLSLTDASTGSVGPLPMGTSCMTTETQSHGAAVVIDPSQVTVTDDDEAVEVTVSNSFGLGSMAITKVLAGSGAGSATGPFAFDVTCTFLGEPLTPAPDPVTITAPKLTAIVTGLPIGATCSVTERPPYGEADGPPVVAPASVVIAGDQVVDITVTNTFTAPPGKPAVTNQSCDTDTGEISSGTITIPENSDFTYEVDGTVLTPGTHEYGPGRYTVIANRNSASGKLATLAVQDVYSWQVEIAPAPDCSTPEHDLAGTGADDSGRTLLAGVLALFVGVLLVRLSRRRRG